MIEADGNVNNALQKQAPRAVLRPPDFFEYLVTLEKGPAVEQVDTVLERVFGGYGFHFLGLLPGMRPEPFDRQTQTFFKSERRGVAQFRARSRGIGLRVAYIAGTRRGVVSGNLNALEFLQ